jgi:hypothetical protein
MKLAEEHTTVLFDCEQRRKHSPVILIRLLIATLSGFRTRSEVLASSAFRPGIRLESVIRVTCIGAGAVMSIKYRRKVFAGGVRQRCVESS